MEPDDAYRWPEALHAKRGLGDYPTAPMAGNSSAFKELWRLALEEPQRFSTDRRDAAVEALLLQPLAVTRQWVGAGRTHGQWRVGPDPGPLPSIGPASLGLVIKSVNCSLCAEVVADWLGAKVVVVTRDLRKVVASWNGLAGFEPEDLHLDHWLGEFVLEGVDIPVVESRIQRIALTVAILQHALRSTARKRGWIEISHEKLVNEPPARIRELVAGLGLRCNPGVDSLIASLQQPGEGFEVRRSAQQLLAWQERLTPGQWRQVDDVLLRFSDSNHGIAGHG